MLRDEAQTVADYCRAKLNLANAKKQDNYSCLPLCVIDAVFSIGVKYTSTRNAVQRFCRYFRIEETAALYPPSNDRQLSIRDFIALSDKFNPTAMADIVYQNHQRTSTKNGILKSEAAFRFATVLRQFEVDYIQDVGRVIGDPDFEALIRLIPGQTSGLSLWYFYMLSGSDDFVKPDRMITRFVLAATGNYFSMEEYREIVVQACQILAEEYVQLTPKILDHQIWSYQSDAG